MLSKIKSFFYSGFVLTMCILLALECVGGVGGHESRINPNSTTEREELEREFLDNRNEILNARWACGDPKPKLVYFEEALRKSETVPDIPSDTVWVTRATVMHRCEAALGCCTFPNTCRPQSSTEVTVTFKTQHLRTRENTYYRIPFSNHTQCVCSIHT